MGLSVLILRIQSLKLAPKIPWFWLLVSRTAPLLQDFWEPDWWGWLAFNVLSCRCRRVEASPARETWTELSSSFPFSCFFHSLLRPI